MITIKNYDSNLDLSNYKIGDVYNFYIHNIRNLPKIDVNDFDPYIESLTETIENNMSTINNNEQYLNFTKSMGIVVDIHKSTYPNDTDYITVILQTSSNDFVINKYVVNYKPTSFQEKLYKLLSTVN